MKLGNTSIPQPQPQPKQDFLNAQAACIGGGTVLENADMWPTPELAQDPSEFINALNLVRINTATLLNLTRGYSPVLTRQQARDLMTSIVKDAGTAYRLLHIAIGDPMFKPEELHTEPLPFEDNPEWPGEIEE